jgi:hypothetical protein
MWANLLQKRWYCMLLQVQLNTKRLAWFGEEKKKEPRWGPSAEHPLTELDCTYTTNFTKRQLTILNQRDVLVLLITG